jgi:hypothetical protein
MRHRHMESRLNEMTSMVGVGQRGANEIIRLESSEFGVENPFVGVLRAETLVPKVSALVGRPA